MDNVLLFFSLQYKGDWQKIYHALEIREKVNSQQLLGIKQKINCEFLTILNDCYPLKLKESCKPPFGIYVYGNKKILSDYYKIIGITGDPAPDAYGIKYAEIITSELIQEKRIILTGDNSGIEKIVCETVIKNRGMLILVVKSDINNFLESHQSFIQKLESCTEFVIISEYYSTTEVVSPDLNYYYCRLLTSLIRSLVIIQISVQNLDAVAMLSSLAKNNDKNIFALPHAADSEHAITNDLIKNGAKIVDSGLSILNYL